jgi:hypothetical protein
MNCSYYYPEHSSGNCVPTFAVQLIAAVRPLRSVPGVNLLLLLWRIPSHRRATLTGVHPESWAITAIADSLGPSAHLQVGEPLLVWDRAISSADHGLELRRGIQYAIIFSFSFQEPFLSCVSCFSSSSSSSSSSCDSVGRSDAILLRTVHVRVSRSGSSGEHPLPAQHRQRVLPTTQPGPRPFVV